MAFYRLHSRVPELQQQRVTVTWVHGPQAIPATTSGRARRRRALSAGDLAAGPSQPQGHACALVEDVQALLLASLLP